MVIWQYVCKRVESLRKYHSISISNFVFIIFFLIKQLDVLVLGDDLATGLGQPVNKTRLALIVLATLLASVNIAAVGTIAFLGLVAPHLARIVVGMNHQRLFVCSALFGAILLSIADLLGRTIAYPKEIPSGLVVAVLGAPYFLWLMRKRRKLIKRRLLVRSLLLINFL